MNLDLLGSVFMISRVVCGYVVELGLIRTLL